MVKMIKPESRHHRGHRATLRGRRGMADHARHGMKTEEPMGSGENSPEATDSPLGAALGTVCLGTAFQLGLEMTPHVLSPVPWAVA